MESQVEKLPKSTVKVTISISPLEMANYFAQATKMVAQQANISGFRKGKAPRTVLENKFGKDEIAHQAMDLAVSQSYYAAVTKHQLKPVTKPTTDLKHEHEHLERDGLTYTATVAVLPNVDLGNYKSLKVKSAASNYTDTLVDETVAQLQKARASQAQVDRPVTQGDRVEIDFVGKKDGKEVPGAGSQNHPVVVGEGMFVTGFEEQLIGMTSKATKTFTVKFPKDYREPTLAGQKVEFTVTVKQVQQVTLPDLNDDFAKNFGAKSISDLRQRLTDNLKREKAEEARRQTEEAAVMKLTDQAKVDIPDPLVDEELAGMLAEFRQQVETQGLSFEQYLGHLKKDEEAIKKELRPQAERRVKVSLVLNTLQEIEGLKPTDKEVEEELKNQLAQVQDDQAKQRIQSDEFRQYVNRILGNRMAVRKLVEHTAGE